MLKPNIEKLNMSRTMMADVITSSVCHNYGIMSGCDEGCPALLHGDCENHEEAIKCCDPDDQDEIKEIYKDGWRKSKLKAVSGPKTTRG